MNRLIGLLAGVMILCAQPALAQAVKSTPPVVTITIGSGYDAVQKSGVFGEALVARGPIGWSIGGGLGVHGDARIEGGLQLFVHPVNGIARFALGVTGFFVAPVSPFDTEKSGQDVGAAVVFHVSPLFRFSATYSHGWASPGIPAGRSGLGWSAMFLLPLFTNAD